jgi:hypothetical protein
MITAILLFWLAFSAVYAVVYLTFSFRGAIEVMRAQDLGCEPRPGLRFTSYWDGALGGLCLISALFTAASLAGQQEGMWRIALLVLINLVMQPICLLMGFMAVRKLASGLVGKLYFAGREIPEEELPDCLSQAERRRLAWYCVAQGLVILPIASFLSLACIQPLL